MFKKILIANRGEIAVRVIKTCKRLGVKTVVVYSDADADSMAVEMADEAVHIGPPPASESYLVMDKIIDAVKQTGAEAIHPGFGFLSENPAFAKRLEKEGITFIGPNPYAIEAMGDKISSKNLAAEAGVSTVPGHMGLIEDTEEALKVSKDIGYPVMIKASAGGGGKGIRVAYNDKEVEEGFPAVKAEAKASFGDDRIFIEKFIESPRHVEIQVMGDKHGNCVYLFERECSIQRRNQKVIEEAPSPLLDEETRKKMGEQAVALAKAVNYDSAGTVEFVASGVDKSFYFLEMNTRLQVEHPVTELITGQDLVAWQLMVAEGRPLPLAQDDIELNGHAIEVRLYAEDPASGFTPQTGTLHQFTPAEGEGLRFDTGVRSGDVVSPHYDPILAKVIAWGQNRDEARRRLIRALEDTTVFGVTTNRHFLSRIIADDTFGAGEATTAFLQQAFRDDPSLAPQPLTIRELALSACALSLGQSAQEGWSNAPATVMPMKLEARDEALELLVRHSGHKLLVAHGEEHYELHLQSQEPGLLCIIDNGVRQRCQYHRSGDSLYLQAFGRSWCVRDITHQPAQGALGTGSGKVQATMDGAIIDVLVAEGDQVEQGQTLVILEAMKMEHPVKADRTGTVGQLLARKGDQVKRGQLLADVQSTEEAES